MYCKAALIIYMGSEGFEYVQWICLSSRDINRKGFKSNWSHGIYQGIAGNHSPVFDHDIVYSACRHLKSKGRSHFDNQNQAFTEHCCFSCASAMRSNVFGCLWLWRATWSFEVASLLFKTVFN